MFPLFTPRHALAVLLAAALHLPAAAFAASSLSVDATGGYGPFVPAETTTGGSISQTHTGSGPRGDNQGYASASFGVLRVFGEAHSLTGASPSLVYGAGYATWQDDFLISSSTLNGQTGHLTLSLQIDGNLTGSGNEPATQTSNRSRASAAYTFSQNGATIGVKSQDYYINTGESVGDDFLNQTQTFTVNFTFGTPFEMRFSVSAGATSYSTGTTAVNTRADLSHTATWGGFSSVTDAQGNPAAYSFGTTSGTDFSQPVVPEPGACALMLATAAGAMTHILRRRRAS